MTLEVRHGNCLDVMREMAESSVDAIVTDPPYALSFMGKRWDASLPTLDMWAECLRVAKPGAHLVAFGGTRTFHRLTCAIEDAGFEIRDCLMWLYGSGFPKSLDVSKAIDRAAGAERAVLGGKAGNPCDGNPCLCTTDNGRFGKTKHAPATEPATAAAAALQGWGTALKPAWESIILARKPLIGTVAANVQEHGTGAINVDGCRINLPDGDALHDGVHHEEKALDTQKQGWGFRAVDRAAGLGRWPANLVLGCACEGEHEPGCAVRLLDEQSGERPSGNGDKHGRKPSGMCASTDWERFKGTSVGGDSGGASRFFYCAKASRAEREEGLEGASYDKANQYGDGLNSATTEQQAASGVDRGTVRNHHPTVKPVALMRWLCRLVTPPNGLILDPFAGSGTTGMACAQEGFSFVGVELEAEYVEIAKARIAWAEQNHDEPKKRAPRKRDERQACLLDDKEAA